MNLEFEPSSLRTESRRLVEITTEIGNRKEHVKSNERTKMNAMIAVEGMCN
jgi:hypothetical protein